MFTGLIETTGTIVSVAPRAGATRITISTPTIAPRLNLGDSVAVSGVCLTALDISLTQFSADLAEETLNRTKLGTLTPGYVVNLELPTPSGAPMGGHVVQGHVDGVGTLVALGPVDPANEATSDWRLRIAVPSQLSKYVAPQGSITVDGISLTVAGVDGDVVSIAIIPHTYAATALNMLLPGSPINIEVDVLAKYAERQTLLTQQAHWTVTEEYLISNGY